MTKKLNEISIIFIYADNCSHCQTTLMVLESAIDKSNIACKIHKMSYDDKSALHIAINKGIDDLPGIVIGDFVFVKHCKENEVIEAIKRTWKKTNQR